MPTETDRDPREVLARDKFYSSRPEPLEDWIWQQGLPDSAQRVFWLHWRLGLQSGDWCSAVALKTVAAKCRLNVSSVTRAYQLLIARGLLRRQDPGRDPSRPFQQAIAITEVRIPRELVVQLDRYPSRPRRVEVEQEHLAARAAAIGETSVGQGVTAPHTTAPFSDLPFKDRRAAMNALISRLSAAERTRYNQAWLARTGVMDFDGDTQLTPEERARVLGLLALMVRKPAAVPTPAPLGTAPARSGPRRLSSLELARLRRELQAIAQSTDVDERLREVVWSIEEGALTRFTELHATRIALKKLREGLWTRPNRMPPQWSRGLTRPSVRAGLAQPETCSAA